MDQARLKSLVHYDPETGIFTLTNSARYYGKVTGSLTRYGYLTVRLDGKNWRANRLAWLYMTGGWPTQHVDHRNGVRTDNRWNNLRDASPSINNQNQRKARSGTRSGLLGVSWIEKAGKWMAKIREPGGRQRYLGLFVDKEAAHAAYLKAKRELHAGCTI